MFCIDSHLCLPCKSAKLLGVIVLFQKDDGDGGKLNEWAMKTRNILRHSNEGMMDGNESFLSFPAFNQ